MEPVCPIIEVLQLEQHLWARCIKHRVSYVKEFLNNYETNPMSYGYNPRILQQVLDALISIVDSAIDLCNRIESMSERKKQELKENLEVIYVKLELFKNRVILEMNNGAKSYALAAKTVAEKQQNATPNTLPDAEVAAIIAAAGATSLPKTEQVNFTETECQQIFDVEY